MFGKKKISASDRAAFEAQRTKVSTTLDATQRQSQISVKKGALTIEGIFMGVLPKGKGKAGATAAAGQGGGGGGGGEKKAPPARMQVVMLVRNLCTARVAGAEYEIVDSQTIRIPARMTSKMKGVNDNLTKAVQAHAQARAQSQNPDVDCAKEKKDEEDARRAVDEAYTIVDWVVIRDGQTYVVSTFEPGASAARALIPMSSINLVGVTASASIWEGEMRTGIDCSSPFQIASQTSLYVSLSRSIDLQQIALRMADPDIKYGDVQPVLFSDYQRTSEEEAAGRGCVYTKILSNSSRPEDYKKKALVKGEPDTLCATWRIWQRQDGSNPGFPAGEYEYLATFLEGGWKEKQDEKNVLRKGFGINNADVFAAILSANPVPAIILTSYNVKDTPKNNPGKNWRTDPGKISTWGNAAHFMLREYLLNNCPRVSFEYVKASLGIEGDKDIYMQNDNPEIPCQLNRASLVKKGTKWVLSRQGVLNLNEYTGRLTDVLAACKTEDNKDNYEFRVMHSVWLNEETREALAELPVEEAEKSLSGDIKAKIRLVAQSIMKVFYLVQPMDADEKKDYEQAEEAWAARKKAEIAAAAAIAAGTVATIEAPITEGEQAEPMDQDQDEDAALLQAAEAASALASQTTAPSGPDASLFDDLLDDDNNNDDDGEAAASAAPEPIVKDKKRARDEPAAQTNGKTTTVKSQKI